MIPFMLMKNWPFECRDRVVYVYRAPGEGPPNRLTQNKSHIFKMMFFATIARPRYNGGAGSCIF
jgi:hypothetical protein